MILLGINGGFTQTDLASLTLADVDLDRAVINTIRGKTGVERIVPLWPETVETVRAALKEQGRTGHRRREG